jgi:hypothetical protein
MELMMEIKYFTRPTSAPTEQVKYFNDLTLIDTLHKDKESQVSLSGYFIKFNEKKIKQILIENSNGIYLYNNFLIKSVRIFLEKIIDFDSIHVKITDKF